MTEQFPNADISSLSVAINAVTTSITVADGSTWPSSGTWSIGVGTEIMTGTARTGNVCTVTRGAEGTTAAAHSIGDEARCILSERAMAQFKADILAAVTPSTPPTGNYLYKVTGGVMDAASVQITDSLVATGAAIAASKVVQATGTGFPHVAGGVLDAASVKVDTTNAAHVTVPATADGVVTSSGTVLQQATRVLAGTDYWSVGANPATTGNGRWTSAFTVLARNNANSDNVAIASKDALDQLWLGMTTAGTKPAYFMYLAGTFGGQCSTADGSGTVIPVLSWFPTFIGASAPIQGYANKPHGVHSVATQAMADANQIADSPVYQRNTIKTTGAITADRTLTLPAATEDTGYTKIADNTCTGAGFGVVYGDGGAGTTVRVPNGTKATVLFDSRGATLTSTAAASPTFRTSILLRNPADTFSYTFTPAAIAAARNITLPLLAADDTMVTEAFAQTLTNKTINGASNTLTARIASDVSGLAANMAAFLAAPSGANFAATLTDETGTGVPVFDTLPTFTTGIKFTGTVASVGLIRTPNNTAAVTARNAANSGDLAVCGSDSSNWVYIGYSPGLSTSAYFGTIAAGNDFIINVGSAIAFRGSSGFVGCYSAMIGGTSLATAGYGTSGGVISSMTDADYSPAAAELKYDFIEVPAALTLTATRKYKVATPATEAAAYYFTLRNITTGRQTITVTRADGAGATCDVPNGATGRFVVRPGGVYPVPAPTSAGGSTVWVAAGSKAASVFSTSNIDYVPCSHSASDTIAFQFIAPYTGTMNISMLYAMSAAEANNIRLRLDVVQLAVGGNPTTALTTGTAFTVTPGNDVVLHSVSGTDSADFAVAITAGSMLRFLFTRLGSDGADTHTGDMRVVEIRVQ